MPSPQPISLIPLEIYFSPTLPIISAKSLSLNQGQKKPCKDGGAVSIGTGLVARMLASARFLGKTVQNEPPNSFSLNILSGKPFRINELRELFKDISA